MAQATPLTLQSFFLNVNYDSGDDIYTMGPNGRWYNTFVYNPYPGSVYAANGKFQVSQAFFTGTVTNTVTSYQTASPHHNESGNLSGRVFTENVTGGTFFESEVIDRSWVSAGHEAVRWEYTYDIPNVLVGGESTEQGTPRAGAGPLFVESTIQQLAPTADIVKGSVHIVGQYEYYLEPIESTIRSVQETQKTLDGARAAAIKQQAAALGIDAAELIARPELAKPGLVSMTTRILGQAAANIGEDAKLRFQLFVDGLNVLAAAAKGDPLAIKKASHEFSATQFELTAWAAEKYINDPPNYDYLTPVEFQTSRFGGADWADFDPAVLAMLNTSLDVYANQIAAIEAFEKYQGAFLSGDLDAALVRLSDYEGYLAALADASRALNDRLGAAQDVFDTLDGDTFDDPQALADFLNGDGYADFTAADLAPLQAFMTKYGLTEEQLLTILNERRTYQASDFTGYDPSQYRTALVGLADSLSGSGAVPEPSAWALLIAGFGLAGVGLRRRRAIV